MSISLRLRSQQRRNKDSSSACSSSIDESDQMSTTSEYNSDDVMEYSTPKSKRIRTPKKCATTISSAKMQPKKKARLSLSPRRKVLTSAIKKTTSIRNQSKSNKITKNSDIESDHLTCEMEAALPENNLEKARKNLHVSSVPGTLPGRENEFSSIYSFLRSKICTASGGCMYISGVPGTGKTATILGAIKRLDNEKGNGRKNIPEFIFAHLNGMRLARPEHLYSRLLKKISNEKHSIDKSLTILSEYFSNKSQKSVIVLLDEVDLLCTRKQTLLYNLFDWTTYPDSQLVVIAVANTMDLPERAFAGRVASRMGLTRLIFQPYHFKQLQTIIQVRLESIPAFDEEAIELVSRKVAAVSGDARRALDICRRATEIPNTSNNTNTTGINSNNNNNNNSKIGINEVDKALTEMFSSPKMAAIRCASLYERILLRSVMTSISEEGTEEVSFESILANYNSFCHFEGLPDCTRVEVMRCLANLISNRLLLSCGNSKLKIMQKIRLNISNDDLNFALKNL